jgi:hypothetical protein
MPDTPYGHTRPGRPEREWEPLAAHLEAVDERAAGFAEGFGGESLARTAAMVHDTGKASTRFLDLPARQGTSTDHPTAGTQLACERQDSDYRKPI